MGNGIFTAPPPDEAWRVFGVLFAIPLLSRPIEQRSERVHAFRDEPKAEAKSQGRPESTLMRR
jgi:hypothetical protein